MILTGKKTHLLFHGDFCVCLYACKDDSNQICILILYILYKLIFIIYHSIKETDKHPHIYRMYILLNLPTFS